MKRREPGQAPDLRTLDDPPGPLPADRIVASAVLAHGIYAGSGWLVRFGVPNRWNRFWWSFLLGAKWERRQTNGERYH